MKNLWQYIITNNALNVSVVKESIGKANKITITNDKGLLTPEKF